MTSFKKPSFLETERGKHFEPLIDQIVACPKPQLSAFLEANMTWNYPKSDLVHWVKVLNHFDELFEKIIAEYGYLLESPKLREISPQDSTLVISCLQFSKLLLENCVNRKLYSSSDRVFKLIDIPCVEIKLAALELCLTLAEGYSATADYPAKSLRMKILHIARAFPPPVPASFIQSRIESQRLVSPDDAHKRAHSDHYSLVDALDRLKKYPSKWKSLVFDYYCSELPKDDKISLKDKDKKPEGLHTFRLNEESVRKLSIEQICDQGSECLPADTLVSFSFHALNAKAFNTSSDDAMNLRAKLLRIKCLAIAYVCLTFNTDFTSCQLFETEPYTLSFLMDLVSPEYYHVISPEIFHTALRTIRAISIRRVWGSELVRHLGGNVNHGLLYQVLRFINKKIRSDEKSDFHESYRIFLGILSNLVDSRTLAPRLVAGGLLTELMSFMNIHTQNRWVATTAIRVISILLTSSDDLIEKFAENDGFRLLVESINYEVEFALDNPGGDGGGPTIVEVYYTISLRQLGYIKILLKFAIGLIQSEAGDRLRNLFDSPILSSFIKIMENPRVFGPAILGETIEAISQIIHNEPTAYAILNEAGVIECIFRNYHNLFLPNSDLILSLLEVLGAIALNKDGLEKIISSKAIPMFFRLFYNEKCAMELMTSFLTSNLSSSMRTLGRHNADLRPIIIDEIANLARNFPSYLSGKFTPAEFRSTETGCLFAGTQDHLDTPTKELPLWDNTPASYSYDAVLIFIASMLGHNDIWQGEVRSKVDFNTWLEYLLIPDLPFDFLDNNGLRDLEVVLRHLNYPSGMSMILTKLHDELGSPAIMDLLNYDGEVLYFERFSKDPAGGTALLSKLLVIQNLLHFTVNYYLHSSNSLAPAPWAEFLEANIDIIEKIAKLTETTFMEEIFLHSSCPRNIAHASTPIVRFMQCDAVVRIGVLPKEELSSEVLHGIKFQNTLQLRKVFDLIRGYSYCFIGSVAQSCVLRRQDQLPAPSMRAFVLATQKIAFWVQDLLEVPKKLPTCQAATFRLFAMYLIKRISSGNPIGKFIYTSLAVNFFHTTHVFQKIADLSIELFRQMPLKDVLRENKEFKAKHELKGTKSFISIDYSPVQINIETLSITIPYLNTFIEPGNLTKFPFTASYFNREYCSKDSLVLEGIRCEAALHCLRLLDRTIGRGSILHEIDDFSSISEMPMIIVHNLAAMIEHVWGCEPSNEYYPLDENRMAYPTDAMDFLRSNLKIEDAECKKFLSFIKNIRYLDGISDESLKTANTSWPKYKEIISAIDLGDSFIYEPIKTKSGDLLQQRRQEEEGFLLHHTLLEMVAYAPNVSLIETSFSTAFSIVPSKIDMLVETMDRVNTVSRKLTEENLAQLSRFVKLLNEMFFHTPQTLEEDTRHIHKKQYLDFVNRFLGNLRESGPAIDLDYFAEGIALVLPIFAAANSSNGDFKWVSEASEPADLKKKIADAALPLQPTLNARVAIAMCKLMYLLAKEEAFVARVAGSALLKSIASQINNFYKFSDEKYHKDIHNGVILVIRTCHETREILADVMSAEITRQFRRHNAAKFDLRHFLDEVTFLAARNTEVFLETAAKMIRIDNYSGKTLLPLKVYLIEDKKSVSSETEDVEMKDAGEQNYNVGLIHHLFRELMRVSKKDWVSTPEEEESKTELDDKRKKKKEDDLSFEYLIKNKNFRYICFLLQSMCELLGSYTQAKLEFITFSKKHSTKQKNKPRLTSLNFFIHQLLPAQLLILLKGPEFQRREAISSLAKLTLLALVSTTVARNDAVPDCSKENPDMAIVRKLVMDNILRILRDTISESSHRAKSYSKVFDTLDLCYCFLSSKFRELCYPLLSRNATKSDLFYLSSAMIDAHLPHQITAILAGFDLNFPKVNKVINVGLKTISNLAKLKLAHADLFESPLADKEDEDIEDIEDKDETPDLFRNSALGMYDNDLDSEEEEFYQDQPLHVVLSESDDMSEDDSENSSEDMSNSDMNLEEDAGEDEDAENAESHDFHGYDSEDSEQDIEIIEDLDLDSHSNVETEEEDFNGFDNEYEDGYDYEDENGSEEEDYDDVDLDGWLEAFADVEETGNRGSTRFSAFDNDDDDEDDEEEEDRDTNDDNHSLSGSDYEDEGNLGYEITPTSERLLGLNPLRSLGSTFTIRNSSVFPQIDAAFQAILNDDFPSSSTSGYILISSTTERWNKAYREIDTAIGGKIVESLRPRLVELIAKDSIAIYEKKAEEKEKARQQKEERLRKKREELQALAEESKKEEEEHEQEQPRDAQESEPQEPIMLWIGDQEVDISGTGIDPEFLGALPEDIREEVFTQHVRERRANASHIGDEIREIDSDFLDALPQLIREDIIHQESLARRLYGYGEDEEAVSLEEENEHLLEAENSAAEEKEEEPQKKRKTFTVPLLDRAGVASIVKLLFLPCAINQREYVYKALAQVCNNKQNRMDVLSMLLAVLYDGLLSQKDLHRMFTQVSSKAGKESKNIRSFPASATPIVVGVQMIEALLYLLEKNPAVRLYFLTEHENVFLAKKVAKKSKLKKSSMEEKYPINLMIKLLENGLLSEEHYFIDLLANALHFATRPLLALKESKPTPPSFHTRFILAGNLKLLIKILVSNECVNYTFRNTISAMHHLSLMGNAQAVFSQELSEKASKLGEVIVHDLEQLQGELKSTQKDDVDVYDSKIISKLTAPSSDQAKLLRILTALDYMYESDKSKESEAAEQDKLTELYRHLDLGKLWKALSGCLRVMEENPNMSHIAMALLPLIESLMIVCKHSKVKELKDVQKYEVKKIDFENEPLQDLFYAFIEEHKKILNQMVRSNSNLMSGPFSMMVRNPKVLEFDNKRNYFNGQLHSKGESGNKLSISIRREQVFLDSYRSLFFKPTEEFKTAKLEINFKGEAGIDAGGVTREWYQVLSRQMFNPDYALFTPVASDENTYHPNRTSYINPEHLSFFKFIGRVIGKAIYDDCFLDCHFSRAVYKEILNKAVSLKDMENLDLEYAKSLMWMLENDITDIITEDFSVETDDYGEHKVIDLVKGGRNIPVTEANKHEYIRLVVEYRLKVSVKEQMSNFIAGFHEVIPKDLVSIFDEQELELLISGLPDINVQDWQNNCTYNNYSASSEQIQWFWRAVKSFDNEERARLLQFSTGTLKVPLNGFKDLRGANGVCKFSIHRDYGAKDRLPSSHTCFNQIDLPVYESYETLRGSLLLAISEGHEGFQLA